MINTQRLAETFTQLVQIDSVSYDEERMFKTMETLFTDLGASVIHDDAASKIGGNTSNLVAKFPGNVDVKPLFLCGHMDTVEPGKGIKVKFEDGIFTSTGNTILASDDKSALAIILEVIRTIQENDLPMPPVEVICTVCEEEGLLGAKNFDYSLMDSEFGYILDSSDVEGIVTRAPGAKKIQIHVHGKAAHAGNAPENGVDAVYAASLAISRLKIGRIDSETTCNLGVIKGGTATNIVPDYVFIDGEARSHNMKILERVVKNIVDTFEDTAAELRKIHGEFPRVKIDVEENFSNTNIPEDHEAVRLARKAAVNLGQPLLSKTIGGAADANIFFGKGIVAGVLGTGMTDVHTVNESIALADMEKSARLVLEILRIHAASELAS